MALIRPFGGKAPRLHDSAFVAEGAMIIGDVEIAADASIWFGTIIRGDVNFVRIGARSNVQDLGMVHVARGKHPTIVGEDVVVGHRVTLHGCTIRDRCLVGIGSTVLDGAVVGEESIVGAGALVAPHTVVPPRTLVLGVPAKPVRPLTAAEIENYREHAARYVGYARQYLAEGWPGR